MSIFGCRGNNEVNKTVDGRKPLITVWAEQHGGINAGAYEWSFGNGVKHNTDRGYVMMAAGRVIRMSLTATAGGTWAGKTRVNMVVSQTEKTAYFVVKPKNVFFGTSTFETPLELAQGDRINFKSVTTNSAVTSGNVCVLIELDL